MSIAKTDTSKITPNGGRPELFIDGILRYVEPELTDSGSYGDRTIARKHLPSEIRVSIASEQWITDVCDVLSQLCAKVKAHPLGVSLIGIQLAYGHCGDKIIKNERFSTVIYNSFTGKRIL